MPSASCLAVDVRVDDSDTPRVRTHGWVREHQLSLWELLQSFADTALRHVLCTDVERDGALGGPNRRCTGGPCDVFRTWPGRRRAASAPG